MAARFMSVPFKFHGPWPRKRYKTNRFINKKKKKKKKEKNSGNETVTRAKAKLFSRINLISAFISVPSSTAPLATHVLGRFVVISWNNCARAKKKSSFKAPTTTSPYIQSGQRIVYGINGAQRASLPLTNCASSETVRHGIRH